MKGLLEHIRVLDLSRLLPGAQCSQLLADLGARVLKVEEPVRGDCMRRINPHVFSVMNRNKMSITLNLTRINRKSSKLKAKDTTSQRVSKS